MCIKNLHIYNYRHRHMHTHTPTHWHTNSPKCTQPYTHKHTYTHLAGDTSTAQGVQIIAPQVRRKLHKLEQATQSLP